MVFGSGYVTIPQMSRVGFWLNLCSIAVITLLGGALMRVFLV
jgi:sodium-dependent dicarboxylate transporter 2/3/5